MGLTPPPKKCKQPSCCDAPTQLDQLKGVKQPPVRKPLCLTEDPERVGGCVPLLVLFV